MTKIAIMYIFFKLQPTKSDMHFWFTPYSPSTVSYPRCSYLINNYVHKVNWSNICKGFDWFVDLFMIFSSILINQRVTCIYIHVSPESNLYRSVVYSLSWKQPLKKQISLPILTKLQPYQYTCTLNTLRVTQWIN